MDCRRLSTDFDVKVARPRLSAAAVGIVTCFWELPAMIGVETEARVDRAVCWVGFRRHAGFEELIVGWPRLPEMW